MDNDNLFLDKEGAMDVEGDSKDFTAEGNSEFNMDLIDPQLLDEVDGIDADSKFALEDYEDLQPGDEEIQDENHIEEPAAKRARPAFFTRTTKAAERSALRTKAEEANQFILLDPEERVNTALSRTPGTFGRRNRDKGSTLPAYHKKVTYDLDSDDELMMDMREKGYSDRQIADKLREEGRVRYEQKSVATRIKRIRKAQAAHMDQLLEEGILEWRLEDDQLLMRAYDLADIEIRYEIERLRAWRFRKVAEHMRRLNKDTMFSANACRDRYISLIDGTAVIPMDEDDDPVARRAEMDRRHAEMEAKREVELKAKMEKEAEELRSKAEAEVRHAQWTADTAVRRREAEQAKAIRDENRAAKAKVREQRSNEKENKKRERETASQAKKAAAAAEKQRKERENELRKAYGRTALKDLKPDFPDPRARVSIVDVQKLCTDRSIIVEGKSKEELVKSLRTHDDQIKTKNLKQMIKEKGLPLGGTKVQMIYQLALAAARSCASFQEEDAAAGEHLNGDETGDLGDEGFVLD